MTSGWNPQGIPIYRGYYIEDLRTFAARLVGRAPVQLRVYPVGGPRGSHLGARDRDSPGKTRPPIKLALDSGLCRRRAGLTTIGRARNGEKTFEWRNPASSWCPVTVPTFSNIRGDRPVRLLNYNYMSLTLSGCRRKLYLWQTVTTARDIQNEKEFYSEAKMVSQNMLNAFGAGVPIGTVISSPT